MKCHLCCYVSRVVMDLTALKDHLDLMGLLDKTVTSASQDLKEHLYVILVLCYTSSFNTRYHFMYL